MIRRIVLACLCFLFICVAALADDAPTNLTQVSDDVLLQFKTADFDASVTIHQTITDDFRKWAKENKFTLSDSTNYQKTRFARLGNHTFSEVSTFNKNDKLIYVYRAALQWHVDKATGVKYGVLTEYRHSPTSKSPGSGLIEVVGADFTPFEEMARQAVYRHVLYDGVKGVVYAAPETKDILEVRNSEPATKAVYSDYQTVDGRRIAKHMTYQMPTPDSNKPAKTVYTDLVAFKSKPDPSIFLNIIPPGAEVRDSIKKIEYIQPKPGETIVPLENCCS